MAVYILKISNKTITASKVSNSITPTIENNQEFNWDDSSLTNVLLRIKQKYGDKKFRVLLSDDLSYSVSFAIPKSEVDKKVAVTQKLQVYIPEDIETLDWDYREFAQDQGGIWVQVEAMVEKFSQVFASAVEKTRIQIEATESVSISLARITQNEKESHLIIYKDNKMLVVFAHNGNVLSNVSFTKNLTKSKINELITSVKDEFGIIPAKIIISGSISQGEQKILEDLKLKIEKKELDPQGGMAVKKDISGPDEKVLNVKPLKKTKKTTTAIDPVSQTSTSKSEKVIENKPEATDEQASETEDKLENQESSKSEENSNEQIDIIAEEKSSEVQDQNKNEGSDNGFLSKLPIKSLYIAILIITIGVASALIFVTQRQNNISEPSPTPSPVIIPDEEPEPIDFSTLNIQILNGTGIPGAAGEVDEIIKNLGVEETTTGNAPSFDFDSTEIRLKSDTPESLYSVLEEALENYNVDKGEELTETSEYDVVIIVGTKDTDE